MDGRIEVDWRKVAGVGVAINAAFAAFVAAAVTAARREERERTRVRWTDANRWE